MVPSLQNMPGLFDPAPSQNDLKDGFDNLMGSVKSVFVLLSLLPGLVVILKVDVLPSVRPLVMTCARPCANFGSFVVCAAAMAAALLFTFVFSFPDCVWFCGLGPFWSGLALLVAMLFVFTLYLVWFGCSSRLFPGLCEGKFKEKDQSYEDPQSSVCFQILPVQVPTGVGILGAAAAIFYLFALVDAFDAAAFKLLFVDLTAACAAAAIHYSLVLVGVLVAATSELLFSAAAASWHVAVTALCIVLSAAAFTMVLTSVRAFVLWKVFAVACFTCALVGAFVLASAAPQSVDVMLSAAACCYMFTLVGAYLLVYAVAHVLVPAWLSAAALCYLFALVGAFLMVSAYFSAFDEMWQQAAAARGCHIAFWAKATPRWTWVTPPIR